MLVNEEMAPARTLHGEDFCVVEHRTTGRFPDGFMGAPGSGRPVVFTMLHVFEFHGGAISRENVCLNVGAIVARLPAGAGSPARVGLGRLRRGRGGGRAELSFVSAVMLAGGHGWGSCACGLAAASVKAGGSGVSRWPLGAG